MLVALAALLPACGNDAELDSVASVTGAHGMPVPEIAHLSESQGDRLFIYEVDARLDNLREWYRRTIVPGQAVGTWEWCGFQAFESPQVEFYHYVDRRAGRSLELFAAQDRGAPRPGVAIKVVDLVRDC